MINPAEYGKMKRVIKLDFYVKANQLSDKDFKEIIGVEKATFETMVKILKEAYEQKPKKYRGGRKKKRHTIKAQTVVNRAKG
ncbi:MAG: hypothetical protein NC078_03080, partial [Ruminococcus sp.]|nr:hypothetical protein [Ruminococcus sp.]